jgi:hypothetical protein
MKTSRLLLPIVAAVVLGGIAHAGEFSLGGGHLLAQNSVQSSDVTVTFTERGRSRDNAEGGDSTSTRGARALRGTDDVAAPSSSGGGRASAEQSAPKATEPAPVTSDSPHGVSISPAAAIRRPSYRWQSLVPGTIK